MTKIEKIIFFFLIIFILLLGITILNKTETNSFSNEKLNFDQFSEGVTQLKNNQDANFKVGVSTGPFTIDPVNSWDSASNNVIGQVCEGLFGYNLSDYSLPRVNWLAEEYWWENDVTLHIKLREGISFHDNSPFNATAAKWNLDRLLYLTNCTGTNYGQVAQTQSLWMFSDGVTPIIDFVDIIGTYNITIHLISAYAPLLDLLSYANAYIVSPASTPATDFIDTYSGYLVGTGPFVYDGYDPDFKVYFHAFEYYWQGKANIEDMEFDIISDGTARNDAMLAHEIDFLDGHFTSYLPNFEADLLTTVEYFSDSTGYPGLSYFYLGFNNDKYNSTWREAMSNVINYSYVVDELMGGEAIRAYSPISPGFGSVYNDSLPSTAIPDHGDLTAARQLLVDMGFGDMGWTDAQWISQAVMDPFLNVTYTYNVGNWFRENLLIAMTEWLNLIGIAVTDDGVTYSDFIYYLFIDHNQLGIWSMGWAPDYLDPYNMLDPLFNPSSVSNSGQVNDPQLNAMMADALAETNDDARDIIYKNIQGYLANELYPQAFLYHPKVSYVYSANLTNFPHNALAKLYFYPCTWTPEVPTPPSNAIIYINDLDPKYNWSKTTLENDWCTGSGTFGDPYVIQDLNLDGHLNYRGIEVRNSSVYFRIENCTFYNCLYGIYLNNVNNSLIYNNSIYDTKSNWGGITLEFSNNNSIILNKISNVTEYYGAGIFQIYSDDCIISQNTITNTYGGIFSGYGSRATIIDNDVSLSSIGLGTLYATNNTIKNNDVYLNTYGILLQYTNDTLVKLNNAFNNDLSGIMLLGDPYMGIGCFYNIIIENLIYDNTMQGLSITEFNHINKVYLNTFTGNGLHAQDNGTLNEWDNGVVGNYWDDYSGVDLNDDGIGDTPYLINGTAGSLDNHPIFEYIPDDLIAPIITINTPNNGDLFSAAPDYNITIIEDNLDSIWYTLDDGVNNFTVVSYSGGIDTIAWNVLSDGMVIITFYVNDTSGNLGFAEMTVYKDTVVPTIVINNPFSAGFFSGPPNYDIEVTDDNLDTVWYTMDGGTTIIKIIVYTGSVDEALWNSLPDGEITITFYANDTIGNIGSNSVIVVKEKSTTPTPFIPGYNTICIFLILSFTIMGLSWGIKTKLE